MKKTFMSVVAVAAMLSMTACSSDDLATAGNDNDVQTIRIAVASTGDRSSRSRELNSEEPGQNIKKVTVVIRKKADNTVVYTHTITNWNQDATSTVYTTEGHGRYAELKLKGNDRLNAGEYVITAVGYTDDDVKDNTVTAATAGSVSAGNFSATVADNAEAQETFAGESGISLAVNHGAINTSVTLHRQVAGYYGYFTSIPVKVAGKEVTDVRLVAVTKNTKVTFGNFNTNFTTTDNNVMYVMNGSEAAAADAKFSGSTTDDANVIYDIKVAQWFTSDTNGDGIYDEKDAANWKNALADKGYKTYQPGTIFAGGFAVPVAAVNGKHTLELQLLDGEGNILKSWVVNMAQAQQAGQDVEGNQLAATETSTAFSLFRNHMYTLGAKYHNIDNPDPDNPDPDVPEPLDKSQKLTLRVNDNWEVINHMNIGD